MEIDLTRVKTFKTPDEFGQWLALHHANSTELWVKIFKKQSGQQSITWDECVIEAIAWGWIDGIKKSVDATAYMQRLTPRKASSNWSTRNKGHAQQLIASNRMKAAGQHMVDLAKSNGRWDAAYTGQAEMQLPADFLHALNEQPTAKAVFETLNRANVFSIYHRLQTAKRAETRQVRMEKIIAALLQNKKFPG